MWPHVVVIHFWTRSENTRGRSWLFVGTLVFYHPLSAAYERVPLVMLGNFCTRPRARSRTGLNLTRNYCLRGCLHDTGATFAPERVHSGSLSWLYICLQDTTTKCYAGVSHPGVSSPRFSHRGENFTPVRNLATVSCKRETTTHFGVKSVWNG